MKSKMWLFNSLFDRNQPVKSIQACGPKETYVDPDQPQWWCRLADTKPLKI